MSDAEHALDYHILMVDDEPRITDMVRDILTSAGLVDRFDSFQDPISALEFLKVCEDPPDLILLDVHFENSGLTGVDILPFIREEQPYLPVVLLTGMEGEVIEVAQDFELVYYIPKPVSPEHLVRMVRFYMGAAVKSGQRLAELSQDLSEYKELLDILENELAEAKVPGPSSPVASTDQPPKRRDLKAFERVARILETVLRQTELMPSFLQDFEKLFHADSVLLTRIVEAIIQYDAMDSPPPGLNVHKYLDVVDNVYSLRLNRKARLFFHKSPRTNHRRMLRVDVEHDTPGMLKWLKANAESFDTE